MEVAETAAGGTRELGRIAALHTRLILVAAARAGLKPEDILEEADVTLPSDPDVGSFVPLTTHEAVYEAAARRMGAAALPLAMGEVACGARFDLYSYAVRSQDTIGDALRLGVELHRRTTPHLWFGVEEREAELKWVISRTSEPRTGWQRGEIEYLLSAGLTAFEETAQRPVRLLEVRFGHPPSGPLAAYENRFRAPVRFSHHRSELVFPAEVGAWPCPERDPRLARLLLRQIREALGSAAPDARLSVHARTTIEKNLGKGFDEAVLASLMGMPVRTLQHRLRKEGTSFSGLRDDIRRLRALALVTEGDSPIAEVSRQLGYGDVRSFHRAFRRWTGSSPASYREQGTGR